MLPEAMKCGGNNRKRNSFEQTHRPLRDRCNGGRFPGRPHCAPEECTRLILLSSDWLSTGSGCVQARALHGLSRTKKMSQIGVLVTVALWLILSSYDKLPPREMPRSPDDSND
jgi:hypothetical protein